MKKFIAIGLVAMLVGCAQTEFYRNGQLIARFQGDMTNMQFSCTSNGAITWQCAQVSHSDATKAVGASIGVAAGAIGAGVAGIILAHGLLPGAPVFPVIPHLPVVPLHP